MAIDKSELKRIIAVMKSGKIPTDQGSPNSRRQATSLKRRAAAAMVDSVLVKAGLDGSKFSKLVAQDQSALRADFAKERAVAAKHITCVDCHVSECHDGAPPSGQTAWCSFHSGNRLTGQAVSYLATPEPAAQHLYRLPRGTDEQFRQGAR